MLSWNQITSEAVPTAHKNVFCINQEVLDYMEIFPVGFYVWTTKIYLKSNIVKIGQTEFGVRRPGEVLGNGTGIVGDIYILHWFPSECAKEKNYDQRVIHSTLNKNPKFKWLKTHSAGKEFTQLQENIELYDLFDEIVDILGKDIYKKSVQVTSWQLKMINSLGSDLNDGHKVIVAELSARFGKTLTFLLLFLMCDVQVMVVSTYFNSALSSFKQEISKYEEFTNFTSIRINDPDFETKFEQSLKLGKKIIVLQSLHQSKNGLKNAKIISQVQDKIVIVDEADFGSHKKRQRDLIDKTCNGSPLILATGTGADLAATGRNVNSFHSITYLDMMMIRQTDFELSTVAA